MKIGILTTDTAHHRYFLREVAKRLPVGASIELVLFETKPYPWNANAYRWAKRNLVRPWRATLMNPYLQPRSFAKRQHDFEWHRFFPGGCDDLPADMRVVTVESCNATVASELIAQAAPDMLFVYGTGKLKAEIFSGMPLGSYNAHGGRLPSYRGLDTNLWAALDGRFEDMCVTIHHLEPELDAGAVVMERELPAHEDLSIYSMRYFSACICTEMFIEFVTQLSQGPEPSPILRADGSSRYYGPMPWLLKRKANKAIRSWIAHHNS